ncbi:MAG: DUF2974 domain-containing protein [Clostridium sp.]|jgi:hypothetical protein|nr:DUF2974 domain-containing protein [Clostridium sp.]
MHTNVMTYIAHYGRFDFKEFPFCEVDSLIFCQLAYFRYHPQPSLTLSDCYLGATYCLKWQRKKNRDFLYAVASSKRFRQVEIHEYQSLRHAQPPVQFCAMTFFLPDGRAYCAFRGTDDTFVGWRESLGLLQAAPCIGQRLAVRYLERVMGKFPRKFYVGGHSKGGNFAVYAAGHVAAIHQANILRIYCLDGPGFRESVPLRQPVSEQQSVSIRQSGLPQRSVPIHQSSSTRTPPPSAFEPHPPMSKFTPQGGLVGRVLDHTPDITEVRAKGAEANRHDLLAWRVIGARLYPTFKMSGHIGIQAFHRWIEQLDDREVAFLTDEVYDMMCHTDASDVMEFLKGVPRHLPRMRDWAKHGGVKNSNRRRVALQALIRCFGTEFKQQAKQRLTIKGKTIRFHTLRVPLKP